MGMGGCTDYSLELGRGYRFAKTDSFTRVIVGPDRVVVVHPNIDQLAVVGNYAVGHSAYPASRKDGMRYQPGFFVLDMGGGSVNEGLSLSEWLDELHRLGISEMPALKRPTRISRFNR